MKFKKADWTLVNEAEKDGLVVAMTGLVEPKRTEQNKELSNYFCLNVPNYSGSYDEEKGEDLLYGLNSYLEERNVDKHPLDFPLSQGTDVHLIPITDNLQLKVLIADNYYGDGEYAKYVMIDFFLINESTTKQDVDILIDFVKKYLT